jgi:non-heme chloroperoxidase
MPTITTRDGIEIFYKDWGIGRPVVFSHGWPLNADAWDQQLLFMASHGFRVVAHDRRGHGRSAQSCDGNDMDHYAEDLGDLIDTLDLDDALLVGHSTGGGEVVRYIGRHGTSRVSQAVLVAAVPPIMLQSADNPGIRQGVLTDRSQFYKDLSGPFYSANRPGSTVSQGIRDAFWLMSMQVGLEAAYDCVKQFSETDFNDDLKKVDIPLLVIQGDDDQIVPIDDSGRLTAKIVSGAELQVYPGVPHGLTATHTDKLNSDLLAFAKS